MASIRGNEALVAALVHSAMPREAGVPSLPDFLNPPVSSQLQGFGSVNFFLTLVELLTRIALLNATRLVGTLSNSTVEKKRDFHILALSGGGYRALYSATVLSVLEETLGRPLAKHFDLICGTSAGGMLALGLANEIPAVELKSMFEDHGGRIFNNRSWARKALGFWWYAKHRSEGLRSVLEERFGDQTIGHLSHRVLIPTVNCTTGRGQFFKTPHHPKFEFDHSMRLVDVAMATTAAPVYFPLSRNGRGVYADGGLVGNAPGLFGWHEAQHFLPEGPPERIRVLSIGTMSVGAAVRGDVPLDRGFAKWRGDLFNLVISAQESSVDYMLTHFLGEDYYAIDDRATPDQSRDIEQLDRVTVGSTNTLRDRGTHAAQRSLGDEKFVAFRAHLAAPPSFFHGHNKNT